MRLEKDTLGEKYLTDETVYGINTQRAVENFPLSHKKVNLHLIHAMLLVKKAAAKTYENLVEDIEKEKYQAIVAACDELLLKTEEDKSFSQQTEHNRDNQNQAEDNRSGIDALFVTQALQGGAGTSTNMNVNEVIANIALKHLGKNYGDYNCIHPLDDVNRGQSTNDVYPTALRIASIFLIRNLSDACAALQTSLQEKENAFQDIEKLWKFIQTGMTHEFSDSGDTWIVFYSPCFLFFGLLLDLHGTEFIHPESLIMKANTFLFIDQRTRRGQLDQDTQDQHHRR